MKTWEIIWEVLDDTGSPVGALKSSGGQLSWDGRGRIQRTVRNARFSRKEWADVNPFRDRLKLLFVDEFGQATPLGVFWVAQLPKVFIDANSTTAPEPFLVDNGFYLDQPSVRGFYGRVGETLSEVMARVCDEAGIENPVISSATNICAEPLLSPPGTRFLDDLIAATRLANFLPPHFDRNGVLRLVPPPPLKGPPNVVYSSQEIVKSSRVEDDNLLEAPNVFVVIGSGASGSPIVAEAEVPSSAPHSVQNRGGRKVVSVLQEQGVDSQFQAETIARQMALTQAADFETISFQTVQNPLHDCYDIVSVNGKQYRQLSWVFPLAPSAAAMAHTMNRADRME